MTTLGSEIGQKHPTRAAKPWQDQRLVHGGVALMTCAAVGLTSLGLAAPANAQQKGTPSDAEARTLDGSGNNTRDPSLGSAGTQYLRQADPNYADGIAAPTEGPNSRTVSNRVFADLGQNVFSGRGVTQWSWTWGQFLDHTFGLREGGDESAPIDFDVDDPLERFQNDIGAIDFTRSAAAPGTGNNSPREQLNTVSSFIDAHAVYGSSEDRLDWLREGSRDGDPTNNSAKLLLSPGEYLPRATERADAQDAPTMDVEGRLRMDPDSRAIAGDMRANENIALTATHTLFAREHNRIVDQLPADMDEQEKFETARRVVGATQQYITYTEFLPAMGIKLPKYRGYNRKVNPTISNEFATVGYRAHSQVHGEIEMEAETADYTPEQIAAFEAAGIEVTVAGSEIELAVPLNLAFFAPDLVEDLGLTAILTGLGLEAQYANDEQIDNQLRSVLFQIPGQGVADLPACLDGEEMPNCFAGVTDLGAIDIERARDHGIAGYNELRKAYGLAPKTSFKSITGESVESFQNVPNIDQNDPMNDPAIMEFMALFDGDGNQLEPGSDAADGETVRAVRRTALAARLQGIYGSVADVDAFVGMVSEKHLPGSEFGELQHAIWADQFLRLRDGDRYFYGNDNELNRIGRDYGIDYRKTLSQVIGANTDASDLPSNMFFTGAGDPATGGGNNAGGGSGTNNPDPGGNAGTPSNGSAGSGSDSSAQAPTRPGKPKAKARKKRKVKLNWSNSQGSNVTYTVQVSRNGKSWKRLARGVNRSRWSGKARKFSDANRLRFRVVAKNDAGRSDASRTVRLRLRG